MCSKTLWHQNADQSMTICTRYWCIAHKLFARCVMHKLPSSRCHELMALTLAGYLRRRAGHFEIMEACKASKAESYSAKRRKG